VICPHCHQEFTAVTGADIARVARSYLGTPYVHLGRSKRNGIDCLGLILCTAHDLGLTDWDDTAYTDQPDVEHLRECLERFCRPVEGEMAAGDVLLFSIADSPQHLGFCVEPGRMIHAYQTPMRVVDHAIDGKWRRRLVGTYRWRGLAEVKP
jgi:cell wall-associated NlpC family hydrolase